MANFVDFNNPANYKSCSKKIYDIHVCMPPVGTIVLNKLEQADSIQMLNGKEYFTLEEQEKLKQSNPSMYQTLQMLAQNGKLYVVNANTPFVLAGTIGAMWTISADKLANSYSFVESGQPVAITQQTLNRKMTESVLNWTVVRSKPSSSRAMACHIPTSQKGQIQTSCGAVLNINGAGVKHGKGDFVVCDALPNGQPNIAEKRVVNGEVFATTYNNQGWTQCLSNGVSKIITIDKLPNIIGTIQKKEEGISADLFKKKVETFVKELQKAFKFEIVGNKFNIVPKYTGIMHEWDIDKECYQYIIRVKGNFSHTYSVKDRVAGGQTEKTVTAEQTDIYFGYSVTHKDSAICMSISPCIQGGFLTGRLLPNKFSRCMINEEYPYCIQGKSIADINCADEVNEMLSDNSTRFDFIDNRLKESKNLIHLLEKSGYFDSGSFDKGDSITITSKCCNISDLSNITYKDNSMRSVKYLSTSLNFAEKEVFGGGSKHNENLWLDEVLGDYEAKDILAKVGVSRENFISFYRNKMTACDKCTVVGIKNSTTIGADFYYATVLTYKYFNINIEGQNCIVVCIFNADSPHRNSYKYGLDFLITIISESDIGNNYNDVYSYCIDNKHILHNVEGDISKRLLTQKEIDKQKLGNMSTYLDILPRYLNHYCGADSCYSNGFSRLVDMYNNSTISFVSPTDIAKYDKDSLEYSMRVFHNVLGVFWYCFYSSYRKNCNFFDMHSLKVADSEVYDEDCKRHKFVLKDGNWLQCCVWSGKISIDYFNGNTTKRSYVLTKSDFNDFLTSLDNDNNTFKFGTTKFSNTTLYNKIKSVTDDFFKPRKPSVEECKEVLIKVGKAFEGIVPRFGLKFLEPINFKPDGSAFKCIINGDNDNRLSLIFKLDLETSEWGIHTSGRSAGRVLNKTFIICNSNVDVEVDDINKLNDFVRDLFIEICDILNVSLYRQFCSIESLHNYQDYFKINATAVKELNRNSRFLRLVLDNYDSAKVGIDCSTSELYVSYYPKRGNKITQTYNGYTGGDELVAYKNISNIIKSMVINDSNYSDGLKQVLMLPNVRDINITSDVTFSFNSRGSLLSCIVNPDGTYSANGMFYITPVNEMNIDLARVEQLINNFHNAVHYETVH